MQTIENTKTEKLKLLLKHLVAKPSLIRLSGSLLLATLITLFLIYISYINYWTKTIYRTQTVDFNMLLNLMPTKLSMHLVDGDTKELQRTLDSNYGLFGVVITNCQTEQIDCKGQAITYLSKGKIITNANGEKIYQNTEGYANNWQSRLTVGSLQGQVYALLKTPPPLTAELEYQNPRQDNVTNTRRKNKGKVIGRVYFIRNLEPPFLNELIKWLKNPLSASSGTLLNNSIALATVVTSFLVWLMLEFLYYRANLAEQRVVEAEKENLIILAKKYEAEKIAIAATKDKIEAENKVVKAEKENLIILAEKHEAEKIATAANIDKIEAENRELVAKNEALRIKSLWDGFQESFEQDFTAVLANRIEEIRGFFRRLYTDIDNIVHDVRKAPLLLREGSDRDNIVSVLQQQLPTLSESESSEVIKSVVEFVTNTDETIKSIDWVLKDLRQVANLEQDKAQLQGIIHKFLEDRPPHLKNSRITVEFQDNSDKPLWILCNEWHLKSIIKNVLYNCSAALTNFQIDQMLLGEPEFQGQITISCYGDGARACVSIQDNGSGYPQEYLSKLYQTPERVNAQRGRGRGSLIVYSYLKLHYAEVKLENVDTGGGRVTFSFPITLPPLGNAEQLEEGIASTNL